MRTSILTNEQKQIGQEILQLLKHSKHCLLHCHPSPDPDSLGSVLACSEALRQLGKEVTILGGDSVTPKAFMHFPGASEIVPKNFIEFQQEGSLAQIDTFIILDSGSPQMISRKADIVFPEHLQTIVIDHHSSNTGYGKTNLLATQYISTTELLFDLFSEWGIIITPLMAENLYVGLFTDAGGFRYERTTDHSFYMAGTLYTINPNILGSIKTLENSGSEKYLDFLGLALSQKKSVDLGAGTDGTSRKRFVMSYISNKNIVDNGFTPDDWSGNVISNMLKSVSDVYISAFLIEEEPGKVKVSIRTRNQDMYDVSKIAVVLGGGGHTGAAGAMIPKPIEEAIEVLTKTVRDMYGE